MLEGKLRHYKWTEIRRLIQSLHNFKVCIKLVLKEMATHLVVYVSDNKKSKLFHEKRKQMLYESRKKRFLFTSLADKKDKKERNHPASENLSAANTLQTCVTWN